MTNEKAINWIIERMMDGRYTLSQRNSFVFDECYEAGTMAISALKKQIPKKPKITKLFEEECFDRVVCPECEYTLFFNASNIGHARQLRMFTYCPSCGQALDWSMEDNETD